MDTCLKGKGSGKGNGNGKNNWKRWLNLSTVPTQAGAQAGAFCVFIFAAGLILLSFFAPVYVIGILGTPFVILAIFVWEMKGGVSGALFMGLLLMTIYGRHPYNTGALVTGVGILLTVGVVFGWFVQVLREKSHQVLELQRQLEGILEFLPDATFAVDLKHEVILWNRAAEEMTGVKKEEILHRGDYAYAVPFYGEKRPLLVDLVLDNGKEWEEQYARIQKKGHILLGEGYAPCACNGLGLYFWAAASPLYDSQGNVSGAIQCIRDMGERKQREEELKYLSTRDSLTGLYNRAYFEEEIFRLERSRSRSFPISIIVADLDDLKIVNDTLGHNQGDELLKRFAVIMSGQFRATDIVARIGGDEFTVILPQTGRKELEETVLRIRSSINEYNVQNTHLPLNVSMGTVTAGNPGQSLRENLKEADARMYEEKLAKK
jgi:diguanylate cyclase (GGDEF)-like protein/PAS domain S-box-containing protein